MLAAAVLLAGCASATHAASTPRSYPLLSDNWVPGQAQMLALQSGPFHAALTADGACAWIGDVMRPVAWPAGYTVTLNPAVLHGPTGAVVARDGQDVSIGGGYGTATSSRCGGGQAWDVTDVK